MRLLQRLTNPILMPAWWQDLILALPRILCGILMSVSFGAPKFGVPWSPADRKLGFFEVAFWFPTDVAEYGGLFAVAPAFFAWMGAFSEAVGGIFLALGLQTRLFSFLIACTMFVAAVWQQLPNGGMWNALPAAGFFWLTLYTTVLGSGRFGLDYLIAKKWQHANA